jgi:hypothetical protein
VCVNVWCVFALTAPECITLFTLWIRRMEPCLWWGNSAHTHIWIMRGIINYDAIRCKVCRDSAGFFSLPQRREKISIQNTRSSFGLQLWVKSYMTIINKKIFFLINISISVWLEANRQTVFSLAVIWFFSISLMTSIYSFCGTVTKNKKNVTNFQSNE